MTVLGSALALLAGCSAFTRQSCGGNQDYLAARERPPLVMPEGVTGSERVGGQKLVIPPVSPTPDKLDPQPKCLDDPPGFFARKPAKAPAAPATPPAGTVVPPAAPATPAGPKPPGT